MGIPMSKGYSSFEDMGEDDFVSSSPRTSTELQEDLDNLIKSEKNEVIEDSTEETTEE